jgi:GrpB-like predicted nucleotidyltransferase (UPF0157 family)
MESLEQRIQRVVREAIEVVPCHPAWPELFEREKQHLLDCLPHRLIQRIEHFGSTVVPGLSAKPIIDILVGVTSLAATKTHIVPVLEAQGYEYFWRPTYGDDQPPWYAWFIKRDANTGRRTHHIHMVEADFTEHWDRLLFRDYLIEHPEAAAAYQALKIELAARFPRDRLRYAQEKASFIERVTALARS